jgi:hypothetical protein
MPPCGSVSDVSAVCGCVLTRAGDDRAQIEPVGRTVARVILLESGSAPLEEPGSSNAVAAGGMGETDTDLGEPLPQIAFFVRTSLPADLQDLVRSEGPPLLHQTPGQGQGLQRRQRLFRNRLDAGRPIGQRPAKSIARALLPRATSSVAIPVAGHGTHRPATPRTLSDVIRSMVGAGHLNNRDCRCQPVACR